MLLKGKTDLDLDWIVRNSDGILMDSVVEFNLQVVTTTRKKLNALHLRMGFTILLVIRIYVL